MIGRIIEYRQIEDLFKKSWAEWLSKGSENRYDKCKTVIREKIQAWTVLGYFKENEVLGYIIFSNFWDALHIDDIYVCPEHRRQGIAEALVNALKTRTETIYSDCDVDNKNSINLHLKTEFKVLGTLDDWFDETPSIFFKYKKGDKCQK